MKKELPNYLKGAEKNNPAWGRPSPKVLSPPKRSNKKKTPRKDLESTVQRECVKYLKSLGVPVNRQNAGLIHTGTHHIKLAEAGAADLVSIVPDGSGRHLEVECKRRDGKGRQTEDQKNYQRRVERWNGVYLLVTSKEDLEGQLNAIRNT